MGSMGCIAIFEAEARNCGTPRPPHVKSARLGACAASLRAFPTSHRRPYQTQLHPHPPNHPPHTNPTPLSPAAQRGIDLPSLDVTYFTSLSYYILLLFGLRGVMTLVFREEAINDAQMMQQQMQVQKAGTLCVS